MTLKILLSFMIVVADLIMEAVTKMKLDQLSFLQFMVDLIMKSLSDSKVLSELFKKKINFLEINTLDGNQISQMFMVSKIEIELSITLKRELLN